MSFTVNRTSLKPNTWYYTEKNYFKFDTNLIFTVVINGSMTRVQKYAHHLDIINKLNPKEVVKPETLEVLYGK